jgi:hypothetical protein
MSAALLEAEIHLEVDAGIEVLVRHDRAMDGHLQLSTWFSRLVALPSRK